MKRLIYYAGLMIAVVILLPMIIVRGCGAPSTEPEPPEKTVVDTEYKIQVFNAASGESQEMNLEEYIKGVVAAEMPADFDMEALKAQAVAARTFAYGRMSGAYKSRQGVHDDSDICTNSAHCQAWIGKEGAMKKWSILFASRNWGKIERAVNDTKGMIAVYKGNIANTLFHASSAGRTENAEDVWSGASVPYLRSVESDGEEVSKGYITSVFLNIGEVLDKFRTAYPDTRIEESSLEDIEILEHTAGGRVKSLRIGDIIMKGTEFRTMFALRSACFTIETAGEDELKVTTTGHGHGVGMSQWGADSLAKKGGTYKEILQHYYTGIDIIPISYFERQSR